MLLQQLVQYFNDRLEVKHQSNMSPEKPGRFMSGFI